MRFKLQDQKSLAGDQRGVALLELAVILPVLLTIGLGAIDFGNLIYQNHLILNGVRDAARYAAGFQTSTPLANIQNVAVYGMKDISGAPPPRVTGWTAGNVTVAYSTIANGTGSCGAARCFRGGDTITMVTVNASVPYTSLGFMGYLGLGSITLSATHQERLFGVR